MIRKDPDERSIGDWREAHISGEPHDPETCPWCEISEAETEEPKSEEPKSVPVENWQMFPEMDWAEYLSGPEPLYLADDERTVLGVGGRVVGTLNDDGTIDYVDNEEA